MFLIQLNGHSGPTTAFYAEAYDRKWTKMGCLRKRHDLHVFYDVTVSNGLRV